MIATPLLPIALQEHLQDERVTDILINHETEVWIERCGSLERVADLAPGVLDRVLERILTPLGRRLDRLSPMVDARLPDGTRVCAVISPIATAGTCAAFRIFRQHRFHLSDFSAEANNETVIEVISQIIQSEANVVITGATGSGKTSLVATLINLAPTERMVILEDTKEIVIDHGHAVSLEARPSTAEGRGAVTLDDLLRTALRLRPDRIVVGEVRGPEALTLLQALSTGHRRCLATVHANSALDGLQRLEVLALQGLFGWTMSDVQRMVETAVGYVIHMTRGPSGQRIIDHIGQVMPARSTSPTDTNRLSYAYSR